MSKQQGLAEQVKRHLRAREYEAALPILDELVGQQPTAAPLHWHRSTCLEALDRREEALSAVQRVIELNPDFSRAWLQRAELSASLRDEYPEYESDVRKALALDPALAPAHRAMALIHYQRDELDRARSVLDHALKLDPEDHEGYVLRARWISGASWNVGEGEETVKQFSGMPLSRSRLEKAVADLQRALLLAPQMHRYRVQLAQRLHELGRFDEAVAEYDRVLAALPEGESWRELIIEMRERSTGQGAGERNQMAALLEKSATEPRQGRRSVDDDLAESMLRDAARQMRRGADVAVAMEQVSANDVDAMLAINVAEKLYQHGNQPDSDYRPAEAGEFASFMRRAAERSRRQLSALGFEWLGDYEPMHLAPALSEKTLLRCYRSADGSVCAASYALRPNWPGWIAWLLLSLRGEYRRVSIIDLETAFDDGCFLVTNNSGNVSPFAEGLKVAAEALSLGTPAAAMLERHLQRRDDYLRRHPDVRSMATLDIDSVIEVQNQLTRTRNAHRRAIGYVTDAELARMLGERQDLAGRVRQQLALLETSA